MVVVARVVVPDTMSVVMAAFVVVALNRESVVKGRIVDKGVGGDTEEKLSMVANRLVLVALVPVRLTNSRPVK